MRLESAQHKAFIEVTEEGSEAAAATALLGYVLLITFPVSKPHTLCLDITLIFNVVSFRSARPLIHTKFTANHPFLFLIYDKQVSENGPFSHFILLIQVDVILFFGVYQHPPTP